MDKNIRRRERHADPDELTLTAVDPLLAVEAMIVATTC